MNSARERAVEAGARAFEDVSVWPAKTYRERAMSAAIRAAFPILAEELVEQVEMARKVSHGSEFIVTALRARIQQMTEAL